MKEKARKIREMNLRFEKAAHDFHRLTTKETLFTSRYLEVSDALREKEKKLLESFKGSQKTLIKSVARELRDLDAIWNILTEVCYLLH